MVEPGKATTKAEFRPNNISNLMQKADIVALNQLCSLLPDNPLVSFNGLIRSKSSVK